MFLFDFDVLSYASFKLFKYDIRNTEVIHAKGRYRTVDVFKFSFFNRIVDLQNGLLQLLAQLINYRCLVRK